MCLGGGFYRWTGEQIKQGRKFDTLDRGMDGDILIGVRSVRRSDKNYLE